MWGPEQVTAELAYNVATRNVIVVESGRVIGFAESLTQACLFFPGVVFRVLNVQKLENITETLDKSRES